MGIKKFVESFSKLSEGFDQAFGDTIDPAGETDRTDEDNKPVIGFFESRRVMDEEETDGQSGKEVVDLW